jgi:hypothetical protein
MQNDAFVTLVLLLSFYFFWRMGHIYKGFFIYWLKLGDTKNKWYIWGSPYSGFFALMWIAVLIVLCLSLGNSSYMSRMIYTIEPRWNSPLVMLLVVAFEELFFRGLPILVMGLFVRLLNRREDADPDDPADDDEDAAQPAISKRQEEILYFLVGFATSVAFLLFQIINFGVAGMLDALILIQFFIGLVYYWQARMHGFFHAFLGHLIWNFVIQTLVWWGKF